MMKAFIDTEFNGFGGSLISLAIVCENGAEWYGVKNLPAGEETDPWVAEHVVPLIDSEAWSDDLFTYNLHRFLLAHRPSTVVADWPSDFVHFYQCMMGADHSETLSLPIGAELRLDARCNPVTPHNALSDARALRDWYQANVK